MFEAEIDVTLKKTVADPQGLAVKHALDSLSYAGVEEVRVGKVITIRLDADNSEDARTRVDDMCRKLLANPIIEDYTFRIKEE